MNEGRCERKFVIRFLRNVGILGSRKEAAGIGFIYVSRSAFAGSDGSTLEIRLSGPSGYKPLRLTTETTQRRDLPPSTCFYPWRLHPILAGEIKDWALEPSWLVHAAIRSTHLYPTWPSSLMRYTKLPQSMLHSSSFPSFSRGQLLSH